MANQGTETLERGKSIHIATETLRIEFKVLKLLGNKATIRWLVDGEPVKEVGVDGEIIRRPK